MTTPTGDVFRRLRRLYHNLLGPQQSALFRKYQDFESVQVLASLMETPDKFLNDVERFAMSVIFSATYGVRLAALDHPTMTQFYAIWESMLQCKMSTASYLLSVGADTCRVQISCQALCSWTTSLCCHVCHTPFSHGDALPILFAGRRRDSTSLS